MKKRRANRAFTKSRKMRGQHTTRFIPQKCMKMEAERSSETSEQNIMKKDLGRKIQFLPYGRSIGSWISLL
jgi:hypothetical protein